MNTGQEVKATKRGIGKRGDKFKSEYIETVYTLSKNDYSLYKIAEKLQVNQLTLSRWLKKYPNLKEAFLKGRKERYEI